jgi:glycosyltransferase involved in cell wall biosynthesis
MPAYSGAGDAAKAIDSILAQTFPDFELIVVSDGSKDRTAAVLDAVADARIRFIHQENAGIAMTHILRDG